MGHQINSNETDMDDHHIYPKSKVKNFSTKSKFNSIANIVYIDPALNRLDIGDKKPSNYFVDIENNNQAIFNCEQNLIDLESAKNIDSEESADNFINERAEKIANIINRHF